MSNANHIQYTGPASSNPLLAIAMLTVTTQKSRVKIHSYLLGSCVARSRWKRRLRFNPKFAKTAIQVAEETIAKPRQVDGPIDLQSLLLFEAQDICNYVICFRPRKYDVRHILVVGVDGGSAILWKLGGASLSARDGSPLSEISIY